MAAHQELLFRVLENAFCFRNLSQLIPNKMRQIPETARKATEITQKSSLNFFILNSRGFSAVAVKQDFDLKQLLTYHSSSIFLTILSYLEILTLLSYLNILALLDYL